MIKLKWLWAQLKRPFKAIAAKWIKAKVEADSDLKALFTASQGEVPYGTGKPYVLKRGIQQDPTLIEEVAKILEANKNCRECGRPYESIHEEPESVGRGDARPYK